MMMMMAAEEELEEKKVFASCLPGLSFLPFPAILPTRIFPSQIRKGGKKLCTTLLAASSAFCS